MHHHGEGADIILFFSKRGRSRKKQCLSRLSSVGRGKQGERKEYNMGNREKGWRSPSRIEPRKEKKKKSDGRKM